MRHLFKTALISKLWNFAFIDNNVFQFEVSILQCCFNALTILHGIVLLARNKLDFK